MNKIKKWLSVLGPGFITGAADDDPSGIATYVQTGASYGYGLLWTALFMLPLMSAVQEACGRIGAVTGKGIAGVVKEHYGRKILFSVVILVVIANTINIGADIGAMAAAANLLIPIPFVIMTLLFTALMLFLEIFTSYKVYARILKWLGLALIAYPITALIANHDWLTTLKATFIPHIEFSLGFLFLITGVLGTTISPYMFFWQASEEVEEEKEEGIPDKKDGEPRITKTFIRRLRVDTFIGMISSEIATWFIIVVGASTLHAHGITNIDSAADAAKALTPLVHGFPYAGFFAKAIFAVGIVGLGLLGVPVLAGSASYALSEALDWKTGLNLKLKKAHGFYGIITIATLVGLIINFVGINPFQALVFTAVFNGIAAVPLLFIIARISNNKNIMGEHKDGKLSNIILTITFVVMLLAAVGLVYTFVKH